MIQSDLQKGEGTYPDQHIELYKQGTVGQTASFRVGMHCNEIKYPGGN